MGVKMDEISPKYQNPNKILIFFKGKTDNFLPVFVQ